MAERSIEEIVAEVLRLDAEDPEARDGSWAAPDGTCSGRIPLFEAHVSKLIATFRTAAPELAREVQRLQAAAEDRERQHKAALDSLRLERDHARMRLDVDAKRLADEVAVLVKRRVIDSRSPAADALLDFREPPSSPRADRLAALEGEAQRLRTAYGELAVKLRGYAQTWKRFARRKRQEQLDAEHTWLEEHIRVAEMEVQLAELRTAHRTAVDEAARLRTCLQGAEVLCNALKKAQAAGREVADG